MKKTFLFLNIIFCMVFYAGAAEVEYHFQQGFETAKPDGWINTCGSTETTVHVADPPLSFAGKAAVKFEEKHAGEELYLETPQCPNAGTLSFYIAKNADNTLMDLHVYKIVNGSSSKIKSVDVYEMPNRKNGWEQIKIEVNETDNVKFRFTCTTRSGNSAWFAIDDIELTKQGGDVEPPVDPESVEKINTDFGDGSWGTILDERPTSGEYPDGEFNGFKLVKSALVKGSLTGITGIKHTNRIFMDKSSQSAVVEFPTLKDVGELEIHAVTGTDNMSFRLEEYTGGAWSVIGTYVTRKAPDSIYIIPLNRDTETKLRIANNTSSNVVLYKLQTRTYKETQELNLTGSTPAEGSVCYYNLTNNVILTFNKDVVAGNGNITLNGTNIPVASCTIDGKNVSVPVSLESETTGKDYVMTIPEGAFLEKGNTSVQNNAATVNFSTYKTVSFPANYTSQIDVLYSTADISQNRMDIYYPASSDTPVPVVINIHGGGWNHGEKESQSGFNVYFNMGFAVANIEYRMTPQATAPAAVVDVRCAMMYLLKHAAELNIDVNKVIFQGGSAGAHLALTAGYLQKDNRFDTGCNDYTGDFDVIAVIDKYGPSKLEDFMFYTSLVNWLGDYKDDADFIKSISPVHLINENTPPTYIIHGTADPTVPYTQSEALRDALQTAGIKHKFTSVPDGLHGGFPAEYNTLMNEEITVFLTEVLGGLTSICPETNEIEDIIKIEGNSIQINTDENTITDIYEISGKKIFSSISKEITLEQNGFFIIKVNIRDKSYVAKIIK